MVRNLLLLIVSGSLLFSCTDPAPAEVTAATDKDAFIKALTADARLWRFEEMTIEYPDSSVVIDLSTGSGKIPAEIMNGPIRNASITFVAGSSKNVLRETVSSGPCGNQMYPTNGTVWTTLIGIVENSSWMWHEAGETVQVQPTAGCRALLAAVTDGRFQPEKMMMDNANPPMFNKLADAQAGNQPERIVLVAEEDRGAAGKINYRINLRAAWITETTPGGRQTYYKVIY